MKRYLITGAAVSAALFLSTIPAAAQSDEVTFKLYPNPAVLNCITDGSGIAPSAAVTVIRGKQADKLGLVMRHVKPGLAFDMFTVQRSNLQSNGTADPNFGGSFGLAWYQSEVKVNAYGNAQAALFTILLDQIFGFDGDKVNNAPLLSPTQTLHMGVWFDNPQDAVQCGFDPTKPTPFNGDHNAGPVVMITTPDAATKLGPLCTNPDLSTNPATCHP